ncbi:MAG TPA: hypothetical protein VN176_15925 [Verrucomicrobiae bacterium]|nr:hypothetical protein [Verrucomicrobiae bacterium]
MNRIKEIIVIQVAEGGFCCILSVLFARKSSPRGPSCQSQVALAPLPKTLPLEKTAISMQQSARARTKAKAKAKPKPYR